MGTVNGGRISRIRFAGRNRLEPDSQYLPDPDNLPPARSWTERRQGVLAELRGELLAAKRAKQSKRSLAHTRTLGPALDGHIQRLRTAIKMWERDLLIGGQEDQPHSLETLTNWRNAHRA